MGELKKGDHRPACCRKARNLDVTANVEAPSGRVVTRVCRKCGRRHFTAHAEPQRLGVKRG